MPRTPSPAISRSSTTTIVTEPNLALPPPANPLADLHASIGADNWDRDASPVAASAQLVQTSRLAPPPAAAAGASAERAYALAQFSAYYATANASVAAAMSLHAQGQVHAALQTFRRAYRQLLEEGRPNEVCALQPQIEACLRELDRARRRTPG